MKSAAALRIWIAMLGVVALAFGCAPAVLADDGWGINGTFLTSSNGAWAKLDERYTDQPEVISTWTITMQCISPVECTGTVKSDKGWTAPIYTTDGIFFVKRVVPNWRFCDDGTPVQGLQTYHLYPVGPDGHYADHSDEYAGEDHTIGPSGSCGRNQWPVTRMPFYMKRIS